MNEHTFMVLLALLSAAATAVAAIGGVWLGAYLALKGQREAEQRAREQERALADEERDRRAARYLHDVVHTCVMALHDGDAEQRAEAVRTLSVNSLRSDAWELSDRSFVGAVTVAGVGLRLATTVDEGWRVTTYLMRLGTQLVNRIRGDPYEVPALDSYVTPASQPRPEWWPRRTPEAPDGP